MPQNITKAQKIYQLPSVVMKNIEQSLPPELQKPKQTRQKFTPYEDQIIIDLVGDNKYPNWNEIAKHIRGKNGRQCRERYQQYLSPNINKEPWTQEEDNLIIRLYEIYGPSWARIAEFFNGTRTNNSIKNRWNNHLRQNAEQNAFGNRNDSYQLHFSEPASPNFNSNEQFNDSVKVEDDSNENFGIDMEFQDNCFSDFNEESMFGTNNDAFSDDDFFYPFF